MTRSGTRASSCCAALITRPLREGPGEESPYAVRDRHMAEAVHALVDGTAGRVAVWAYNGHIAKGTYGPDVPALGSLLRRRHGEAYYALGLLFGKGQFRARRGGDTTGPAGGPAPDRRRRPLGRIPARPRPPAQLRRRRPPVHLPLPPRTPRTRRGLRRARLRGGVDVLPPPAVISPVTDGRSRNHPFPYHCSWRFPV
ncbi:erythromycin esterase family protein [Streptomyces sp. 147326]|uniref:erythromycin esterase family protein n=1 Tax=Streptomyces sp. 147326 TaxID=3074379 RepID=UPI003857E0FC